ncbi:transcription factor bHLH149-like [Musa acuminata AAA Group]|uniref:transcription factor bHLH149-like n=1 Tax=Musa acuminata AAA Group TaxID=214697 RepID=UPI0031E1505F
MIMIMISTDASAPAKRRTKPSPPENKWRTGARERAYRSRLLEALRAAGERRASGPRAVKEAADSALALTARGQSRWSRAVLLRRRSRLLVRAGGRIRRRKRPRRRPVGPTPGTGQPEEGKKVRDRLRALGRLVPGCENLSTASLLEEAADYVAALEMQVKTMRTLADDLSAAAASGNGRRAEG